MKDNENKKEKAIVEGTLIYQCDVFFHENALKITLNRSEVAKANV